MKTASIHFMPLTLRSSLPLTPSLALASLTPPPSLPSSPKSTLSPLDYCQGSPLYQNLTIKSVSVSTLRNRRETASSPTSPQRLSKGTNSVHSLFPSLGYPLLLFPFSITNILNRWTESEVGGLDTKQFVIPQLIRYPTFDGLQIPAFYYPYTLLPPLPLPFPSCLKFLLPFLTRLPSSLHLGAPLLLCPPV